MYVAAHVVKKIWTGNGVRGVTSIANELFVLMQRVRDQVVVYSMNNYQRLGNLNVPRYEPGLASDMTSCVRHKCLFMSDTGNRCIHRYHLASSTISKWSVPGRPRRLSVTRNCNLLVTCREPNKVVELSVDSGQIVREIALQADIVHPRHSVQLTAGQYVVSQGEEGQGLHQVCVVDDDGNVTRRYGGERGSGVGQLNWPRNVAVDKDSEHIFVADRGNDRVVLLSPTLEFVRYVIEGLAQPCRLHFHQSTRRLFVGQFGSALNVIQL